MTLTTGITTEATSNKPQNSKHYKTLNLYSTTWKRIGYIKWNSKGTCRMHGQYSQVCAIMTATILKHPLSKFLLYLLSFPRSHCGLDLNACWKLVGKTIVFKAVSRQISWALSIAVDLSHAVANWRSTLQVYRLLNISRKCGSWKLWSNLKLLSCIREQCWDNFEFQSNFQTVLCVLFWNITVRKRHPSKQCSLVSDRSLLPVGRTLIAPMIGWPNKWTWRLIPQPRRQSLHFHGAGRCNLFDPTSDFRQPASSAFIGLTT